MSNRCAEKKTLLRRSPWVGDKPVKSSAMEANLNYPQVTIPMEEQTEGPETRFTSESSDFLGSWWDMMATPPTPFGHQISRERWLTLS